MNKYYITFAINHYYENRESLAKHYVLVIATDAEQARSMVVGWANRYMGGHDQWSWLYTEQEFNDKAISNYCPLGRFTTLGFE